MTDATITISAFLTFVLLILYAYRRQGQELKEETRQRRRWQCIAHEHAQERRRWETIAARLHPVARCHSVQIAGDTQPVDYILFGEDVTVPYAIGKSPFSVN